jgi:hypothetical protein
MRGWRKKESAVRWIFLLPLLFLAACTDDRATFEINGSAHSLSLIRITGTPWARTAKYALVASRMPDCMRRHALPNASLNARFEVFSPGNDAWILRQGNRLYVVETRTCEGFARLEAEPEGGLGPLMGSFRMRAGTLAFVPAEAPAASPQQPAAPAS